MMGTNAPKKGTMECVAFGEALLDTLDLDPEYVAVVAAGLDPDTHRRLILGFLLFYHFGAAAYVADSDIRGVFWDRCSDPGVPRFSARRYFRGEAAERALDYLRNRYGSPESAINDLLSFETATGIMARIQEWPSFGPMLAFKAIDMLEATGLTAATITTFPGFYSAPREGASMYAPGLTTEQASARLLSELGLRLAPPLFRRPLGLQEAETIFCKWKSHRAGKYEPGRDVTAMTKELDWRRGALASRLQQALFLSLVNGRRR